MEMFWAAQQETLTFLYFISQSSLPNERLGPSGFPKSIVSVLYLKFTISLLYFPRVACPEGVLGLGHSSQSLFLLSYFL